MKTYRYEARVTSVYDADTITVDIDLGFKAFLKDQKLRLYGIDAWEVRGKERPKGLVGRDRLRELILDKTVVIDSHKDGKGKYGRWLASIVSVDGVEMNVIEMLVEEGHAEWKNY